MDSSSYFSIDFNTKKECIKVMLHSKIGVYPGGYHFFSTNSNGLRHGSLVHVSVMAKFRFGSWNDWT